MSLRAQSALSRLEICDMDAVSYQLLHKLANYANQEGVVDPAPTHKTLAASMRRSDRTIRKRLNGLIEGGFLNLLRLGGGPGKPSAYKLNLPLGDIAMGEDSLSFGGNPSTIERSNGGIMGENTSTINQLNGGIMGEIISTIAQIKILMGEMGERISTIERSNGGTMGETFSTIAQIKTQMGEMGERISTIERSNGGIMGEYFPPLTSRNGGNGGRPIGVRRRLIRKNKDLLFLGSNKEEKEEEEVIINLQDHAPTMVEEIPPSFPPLKNGFVKSPPPTSASEAFPFRPVATKTAVVSAADEKLAAVIKVCQFDDTIPDHVNQASRAVAQLGKKFTAQDILDRFNVPNGVPPSGWNWYIDHWKGRGKPEQGIGGDSPKPADVVENISKSIVNGVNHGIRSTNSKKQTPSVLKIGGSY